MDRQTDELKKKIRREIFFRGSWGPKTHFKHINFFYIFFNPPHDKRVTDRRTDSKKKISRENFFRGSWGPKTHFKQINFSYNFFFNKSVTDRRTWAKMVLLSLKVYKKFFFSILMKNYQGDGLTDRQSDL